MLRRESRGSAWSLQCVTVSERRRLQDEQRGILFFCSAHQMCSSQFRGKMLEVSSERKESRAEDVQCHVESDQLTVKHKTKHSEETMSSVFLVILNSFFLV